jgi:hypothetical protein
LAAVAVAAAVPAVGLAASVAASAEALAEVSAMAATEARVEAAVVEVAEVAAGMDVRSKERHPRAVPIPRAVLRRGSPSRRV